MTTIVYTKSIDRMDQPKKKSRGHLTMKFNTYGEYITIGDIDEAEFTKECKNYTNFRKVFRDKLKTSYHRCSGIGDVCEYTGSPGCGVS